MSQQIDFSTPLTDTELDAMLGMGDFIASLPAVPGVGAGFVESEALSEEEYWGVHTA